MPDENGTEATRSGAPGADESPFTDAADNAPCAVVENETAQDSQGAAEAGDKPDTEAQADPPEDLKVVVSIKGDRATIGVQRPSSDPHVESFDATDLSGLAGEVDRVNAARNHAGLKDTLLTQTLGTIFLNVQSIGTGAILIVAGQAILDGQFTVGDLGCSYSIWRRSRCFLRASVRH